MKLGRLCRGGRGGQDLQPKGQVDLGELVLARSSEIWNEGAGISDTSKALKWNRKSIVLLVKVLVDEGFY